MRKIKLISVVLGICLILGLVGCGTTTSSSGSSSSEDSDSSSTSVTLTGTIASGTLGTSSLNQNLKPLAATDYTIVVVDNDSNKIYNTTANAEGEFSLDVPTDGTYLVSIINDGSYLGPTVFDGEGTEVNTAITPSANADLGAITVDSTNGYAQTATTPADVATSITSEATNGKPLGAGNDGKTENSGVTNRTDSDKDKDGIPNLFDADEDNDGIRNGVASAASSTEVVSDYVESVYMSSNIWADHNTTEGAEDLIALRLHVVPVAGQESMIASVACTSVPSSIASVATVRYADSLGSPTGYPAENSLWQTASYGLYETTTLASDQWIISICPKAIMNVGDTFTIRVTYTDATYEDFFVTTAYVLTDWAKITEYNSTAMPVEGTKTDPVTYSSDTLEITFSKPLDEDGDVLAGLSYSVIYGVSTLDGSIYLVPGSSTESSVTDTGSDTLSYTITTTANATYYVTPVAESADGQRNGEETWFTRQ
ncbi:hypothetical protein HN511_07135 [bacterium]|nr:hypothetical protein [bacterium]